MNKTHQESLQDSFAFFSQAAAVIVSFTGCIVLLGWLFDITAMKSVFPGLVTMKPNTALCIMLAGLALWSAQEKRINKINLLVTRSCCIFVMGLSLITIIEYVYGVNLGIDQLMFKDDPGALFTTYPGRMALHTAAGFALVAIALFLSNSKNKRGYIFMQILSLLVVILSVLSLLWYVYEVKIFNLGGKRTTVMALHTALAFLLIGLGIFFLRPKQWLAGTITSDNLGSKVARRLIPVAVFIPPILGWIKIWGEQHGYLPNEFGVSFVALMNMITIISCVIWLVTYLNRIDLERRRTEDILRASQQQMQAANQQLRASQQQLKASNLQLIANEQKLQAEIAERKRIEELDDRHIHELEVFYKSSVGREERIIELKKEIEDLKNKLK